MTQAAEYTLSSPPPCPTNRDLLLSVAPAPTAYAGLLARLDHFVIERGRSSPWNDP